MNIFGVDDLPVERELVISAVEGDFVLFGGEAKAFPLAECEALLGGIYGANWVGQRVVLHAVDRPYTNGPQVLMKIRGAAVPPVNETPTRIF